MTKRMAKTFEDLERIKLDELADEATAIARRLRRKKGSDYSHFGQYPPMVHASTLLAKGKRAFNLLLKLSARPDQHPYFESIEDSCVDAINYASFVYAIMKWGKGRGQAIRQWGGSDGKKG